LSLEKGKGGKIVQVRFKNSDGEPAVVPLQGTYPRAMFSHKHLPSMLMELRGNGMPMQEGPYDDEKGKGTLKKIAWRMSSESRNNPVKKLNWLAEALTPRVMSVPIPVGDQLGVGVTEVAAPQSATHPAIRIFYDEGGYVYSRDHDRVMTIGKLLASPRMKIDKSTLFHYDKGLDLDQEFLLALFPEEIVGFAPAILRADNMADTFFAKFWAIGSKEEGQDLVHSWGGVTFKSSKEIAAFLISGLETSEIIGFDIYSDQALMSQFWLRTGSNCTRRELSKIGMDIERDKFEQEGLKAKIRAINGFADKAADFWKDNPDIDVFREGAKIEEIRLRRKWKDREQVGLAESIEMEINILNNAILKAGGIAEKRSFGRHGPGMKPKDVVAKMKEIIGALQAGLMLHGANSVPLSHVCATVRATIDMGLPQFGLQKAEHSELLKAFAGIHTILMNAPR